MIPALDTSHTTGAKPDGLNPSAPRWGARDVLLVLLLAIVFFILLRPTFQDPFYWDSTFAVDTATRLVQGWLNPHMKGFADPGTSGPDPRVVRAGLADLPRRSGLVAASGRLAAVFSHAALFVSHWRVAGRSAAGLCRRVARHAGSALPGAERRHLSGCALGRIGHRNPVLSAHRSAAKVRPRRSFGCSHLHSHRHFSMPADRDWRPA